MIPHTTTTNEINQQKTEMAKHRTNKEQKKT